MDSLPKEIKIPPYWKHGHWLTLRDALHPSHPESTYQYIKNILKLPPEAYGYFYYAQCPKCGYNLQEPENE